jgi:hypothetical protein
MPMLRTNLIRSILESRLGLEAFYRSCCVAILLWVASFGFVYGVLLPPFQVPDEFAHWAAANTRIESTLGLQKPGCNLENNLGLHLKSAELPFNPEKKVQVGLFQSIDQVKKNCAPAEIAYGTVLTYPGVVAARLLTGIRSSNGSGALYTFYLSRLLQGGVLLLILVHIAIRHGFFNPKKTLPPGVLSLAILSTSPLFIQQSFGITSDLIVNVALLMTASTLLRPHSLSNLEIMLHLGLGITAAVTKPVIAPLFLIGPLFLLKTNSERKRFWLEPKDYPLAIVGLALSAIAVIAILTNRGISQPNGEINPTENLHHLVKNPFFALEILNLSIQERMFGLRGLISPLGWIDLNLTKPTQNYWLLACVMALGLELLRYFSYLFGDDAAESSRIYSKIKSAFTKLLASLTLIWGSAIGTSLAMYMCCTPLNYGAVYAVQNRYFFPHWIALFGAFFGTLNSIHTSSNKVHDLNFSPNKSSINLVSFGALAVVLLFMLGFGLQVVLALLARYY